jgi:hypothetical protein
LDRASGSFLNETSFPCGFRIPAFLSFGRLDATVAPRIREKCRLKKSLYYSYRRYAGDSAPAGSLFNRPGIHSVTGVQFRS